MHLFILGLLLFYFEGDFLSLASFLYLSGDAHQDAKEFLYRFL